METSAGRVMYGDELGGSRGKDAVFFTSCYCFLRVQFLMLLDFLLFNFLHLIMDMGRGPDFRLLTIVY